MKKILMKFFKDIFTDDEKLTVFSFSFLFVALFLFLLGFNTTSKSLLTQRGILSTICLFIGFYFIPFLDMKQKDKSVIEYSKFCIFLLATFLSFYYWFISLTYNKTPLIFDIIFIFISVGATYYFLTKLFQIGKVFLKFINKLSSKLFPNSTKSTGFKYFFEHLTAILISISGALGTVLAIATSTKAIIDMFQK